MPPRRRCRRRGRSPPAAKCGIPCAGRRAPPSRGWRTPARDDRWWGGRSRGARGRARWWGRGSAGNAVRSHTPSLAPPARLALGQERLDPFAEVLAHVRLDDVVAAARRSPVPHDAVQLLLCGAHGERRVGGRCPRHLPGPLVELVLGGDLVEPPP